MSNTATNETITLTIGKSEALILFDFLADFHQQSSLSVNDNAERLALVRLHGALEGTLLEPFSPDYREIIVAVTTSPDSGATRAMRCQTHLIND